MQRTKIKAVLLLVIVITPLFTFVLLGTRLSPLPDGGSGDAAFLTLKEFWYPVDQTSHVFPMFIMGAVAGYRRGLTMSLPSKARIDVFAMDATDSSTDFTWMDAVSLTQLGDGDSVHVSYTPAVNSTSGEYGENSVKYHAGLESSVTWDAQGDVGKVSGIVLEDNVPQPSNNSLTHLCTIELAFDLTRLGPEDSSVVFTLLLALSISRSDALMIAGHEVNFMISFSYYWTDYTLGVFQTATNHTGEWFDVPWNLTLGNGETYGQWDCGVIYALEGNVEYTVSDSEV